MIRAAALSVYAGRRALLDRVSLEIAPGTVTALLGANGAGKSTVIRVLAGDHRPDEGLVEIDGTRLDRLSPLALARRRAVMPQSASLDFGFTAAEVVALGRLPYAGTAAMLEDDEAIGAAGAATGIAALWHRAYPTLSGGEQQRVQLARVLAQLWQADGAREQRYLLLDEPVSALDLQQQRIIFDVLRRLARQGVGILAVVHDLPLAAAYADRVVLLREGRLLAAGTPEATLTPELIDTCFGITVETAWRNGQIAIFHAASHDG